MLCSPLTMRKESWGEMNWERSEKNECGTGRGSTCSRTCVRRARRWGRGRGEARGAARAVARRRPAACLPASSHDTPPRHAPRCVRWVPRPRAAPPCSPRFSSTSLHGAEAVEHISVRRRRAGAAGGPTAPLALRRRPGCPLVSRPLPPHPLPSHAPAPPRPPLSRCMSMKTVGGYTSSMKVGASKYS